jgi:mono/diheme cytochrome c family protein
LVAFIHHALRHLRFIFWGTHHATFRADYAPRRERFGGNMKTGLTWISTSLVAGALVLGACSKGGSETSGGGGAASGGEPAIVVTDQAEWDTLKTAGKTSYDNACGSCHPGGEADLGPALKGHSESTAKMTKQIRNGSGRMAPIGEDKLPEAEMKGLLVYLSTIDAVGDVKGP